jgi:Ca2+/Na+ antiporter
LILNSIVFIAIGIALCLYAPLALALFKITEVEGINAIAYWYIVSFVRLFGAALFGSGLSIWTFSSSIIELSPRTRSGLLYSLIIGNTIVVITILTQQISIWQSTFGWIMLILFAAFLFGYGYLLSQERKSD